MTVSPDQRARHLDDLTPKMARALVRCANQPVLVTDPGAAGIGRQTLAALIRHELVVKARDRRSREVWRPSEHGVEVIRTQAPVLLAAQSDALYTSEPSRAMFAEPEAMPRTAAELQQSRDVHEARRAGVDEELVGQQAGLEDRLRLLRRVAAERGIDIRSEVRCIEARTKKIEARIRDQRSGLRRAA